MRRIGGPVLLSAALAVLLVGAGTVTSSAQPVAPPTPVLADAPPASWPEPAGVDGESYLLMEVATGQLLAARDADRRRPVASTLKLLTVYTAVQRVDLDDVVTAGEEVLGVGGAGVGLQPGDRWTVEELIDALIGRSGNEAAEALAVHVAGDRDRFLRLMEQDAAALGATGLSITSPSGLDDDTLLSARDLALIGRAVLAEPALRPALTRRVIALPGQPAEEHRNELLVSYPGATGMKTGYTAAAGYSLVGSAERGGRELIAVVLGAGEDGRRFESAAALLDHGFDATRPTVLGTEVALSVGGGRVVLATEEVTVTVPAASDASLELRLPIRAPEEPLRVPIVVDGESLAALSATPTGRPAPVDDDAARIGRALVDGTYAALRAATGGGTLG